MSSRPVDRGRGGSEVFLSAHRCPEVDLPPRLHGDASPEQVTCAGEAQGDYLSVCQSEEGSESDWSEEDLSLHFSPSVVLQSEDDASDPENGFRCVDVTMETQVTAQEGAGLKTVPKRQIQLKKKKKGGGAHSAESAGHFCPTVHSRPDALLRQHSVPASFSGDVEYRVYRGLVSGAPQVGGASPRRLQKSLSLDETKTKMASCIIKSVLSKKMQVEQRTRTSKTAEEREGGASSVERQRGKEGGASPVEWQRGKEGGAAGAWKVRDVKSLVKNTYSLSFAAATTPHDKPTSFKLIGRDSPPPTYQQAVEVKGRQKFQSSRGHVAKVAASFSQSPSRPITRQPVTRRGRSNDVAWTVTSEDTPPSIAATVGQSERSVRGGAPPPASSYTGSHSGSAHSCVFNDKPRPQAPSAPSRHLLERSEENTSEEPDCSRKPRPTQITVTPPTQNPPCRLQGFLPAQVGGDFLVAGAALPPGAFLSSPAPCHVMFEPQSGRCYYVDTPPQHQRKMLLDPETGQFFQVLLPTASPAPSTHLFPMCCVNPAPAFINPAPTMLQTSGANPSVLSMMRFQPMASSLYGSAPCLPFAVFTPSTNFTLASPQ